jgi:hypothetical protein
MISPLLLLPLLFFSLPLFFAAFGLKAGQPLVMGCIRRKFDPPWVNRLYPAECAQPIDGGEAGKVI